MEWFIILCLAAFVGVAWVATKCGWPERAPMDECK